MGFITSVRWMGTGFVLRLRWRLWRSERRLRAQHLQVRGAAARRGACGRGGRFLKKAPQKLFSRGQPGDASFCDGESWDSPSVRYKKRKTKASFRFTLFVSDLQFFSLAGEGKELQNDLDSSTARVWERFLGGSCSRFVGRKDPFPKSSWRCRNLLSRRF